MLASHLHVPGWMAAMTLAVCMLVSATLFVLVIVMLFTTWNERRR